MIPDESKFWRGERDWPELPGASPWKAAVAELDQCRRGVAHKLNGAVDRVRSYPRAPFLREAPQLGRVPREYKPPSARGGQCDLLLLPRRAPQTGERWLRAPTIRPLSAPWLATFQQGLPFTGEGSH